MGERAQLPEGAQLAQALVERVKVSVERIRLKHAAVA